MTYFKKFKGSLIYSSDSLYGAYMYALKNIAEKEERERALQCN